MRHVILVLTFAATTIGSGIALCADAEPGAARGYAVSRPTVVPAAAPANVRLSFSTEQGSDAAPVHVLIRDRSGATWLEQTSPVSAMTVSMPPGTYDIAATYNGRRLTRDVAISDEERYVGQFIWSP